MPNYSVFFPPDDEWGHPAQPKAWGEAVADLLRHHPSAAKEPFVLEQFFEKAMHDYADFSTGVALESMGG